MNQVLPPSTAQGNLLSLTGHELRTPLNGITGALDLLKGTPLTPEQAHYVELIHSCVGEITVLANRLKKASEQVDTGEKSLLPDLQELPILNPEQIEVLREEGLLERLTGLFKETAEKAIQDIKTAFQNDNAKALSSAAHLLKGSAANFGAERLVAICQTLELSAEEPKGAVAELLNALDEEYALAIKELDLV